MILQGPSISACARIVCMLNVSWSASRSAHYGVKFVQQHLNCSKKKLQNEWPKCLNCLFFRSLPGAKGGLGDNSPWVSLTTHIFCYRVEAEDRVRTFEQEGGRRRSLFLWRKYVKTVPADRSKFRLFLSSPFPLTDWSHWQRDHIYITSNSS